MVFINKLPPTSVAMVVINHNYTFRCFRYLFSDAQVGIIITLGAWQPISQLSKIALPLIARSN